MRALEAQPPTLQPLAVGLGGLLSQLHEGAPHCNTQLAGQTVSKLSS